MLNTNKLCSENSLNQNQLASQKQAEYQKLLCIIWKVVDNNWAVV